ncbi:MAG: hypothetical protein Q7I94_07585 [Candidatus Contubernalis sp.]|nr:hypothetical protein [Candidatus Contubernalis sp.]
MSPKSQCSKSEEISASLTMNPHPIQPVHAPPVFIGIQTLRDLERRRVVINWRAGL